MACVGRGDFPYYPKSDGRGRPPIGLERMLRMYIAQQCFGLSDEGTEDAIYDSQAIRGFVGIDLSHESAPDASTLLKFRRLLEQHKLTQPESTLASEAAPNFSNLEKNLENHATQIGVRNSKNGTIVGAHNEESFLKSVSDLNAKIIARRSSDAYPGVFEYDYQLPKLDSAGNPSGGYKPMETKTVCDPNVLSDSYVAELALRASRSAEKSFLTNPKAREKQSLLKAIISG